MTVQRAPSNRFDMASSLGRALARLLPEHRVVDRILLAREHADVLLDLPIVVAVEVVERRPLAVVKLDTLPIVRVGRVR